VRWILCGKNDAAVAILEHLVAHGDEVRVVATRGDDGSDGWQRSLAGAAARLRVPVHRPRRINDPEAAAELAGLGADALLSVQYDQILRGPLFAAVGCPCLNLHFSLLPRHRGVSPIAWAILEGDTRSGATLHHMVEAIDAGELIAQREIPIGPGDSAREVYDRISAAAADLFRACYPLTDELLRRRLEQDEAAACYHAAGDIDFSRRRVDWSRPAAELQRWLRAMIFPPFQYPESQLDGRTWQIRRVAPAPGRGPAAAPGTILAAGPDVIEVAAGGGSLRISELLACGEDGAQGAAPRVGGRFR
jgi:methionyl-tRNA formyltransferase